MDKYLVVILLPEPLRTDASKIQQRYKTPAWNISLPPHLTLLPPAEARADAIVAETALRQAAAQLRPFDLKIEGIGTFPNAGNTVFAKVRLSWELAELQSALRQVSGQFQQIAAHETDRPYHPHVTLANRLPPDAVQTIVNQIRESSFGGSFTVSGFSLMQKSPNQRQWQEVKFIAL